MNDKSLERKLRGRSARVAVVGLGYAGLPMAVEFARAGFSVVGFDVSVERVTAVSRGHSPVSNVSDTEVAALRESDQLTASADPRELDAADVAVLCVPTPLNPDGGPDLGFVESAGATVAEHLHPGMLVVLQSTCGPRTTSDLLCPLLERQSGLRAGEDFFLVFAPERIDPGNTRFGVKNTPKLVGGVTPESTRLARLLYEACIDEVVPVSSPEVAEMAKLVENTFRFINISFVNEMALLCDRLGINVWEVIEAAKTKPFAFMPHYPSPGVGGHCIPVVPQYLDAAARDQGLASQLIPAANRVNAAMPRLVVDKLEHALAAMNRSLVDANVLLVGVTYKPDIADIRESAAIRVLEEAASRGARVSYHDPLTPSLTLCQPAHPSLTSAPAIQQTPPPPAAPGHETSMISTSAARSEQAMLTSAAPRQSTSLTAAAPTDEASLTSAAPSNEALLTPPARNQKASLASAIPSQQPSLTSAASCQELSQMSAAPAPGRSSCAPATSTPPTPNGIADPASRTPALAPTNSAEQTPACERTTLRSVALDSATVAAADAVVLLTPHTSIDYDRIVRNARLVIDTHSGLHPREAPNVVNVWVPATAPNATLPL